MQPDPQQPPTNSSNPSPKREGDAIDARHSQGTSVGNQGEINQQFGDTANMGGGDSIKGNKNEFNTAGGSVFAGPVNYYTPRAI